MDHHDHDHMAAGHDHHDMMPSGAPTAANVHRMDHSNHGGGGEDGGMECSMQMIVSVK